MQCIPFAKLSPGGNITVLLSCSLSPDERVKVCAEVISNQHLVAEQAGLICLDGDMPFLNMMGGEFCVNATRSMAALLAADGRLTPIGPDSYGGTVRVSGVKEPLKVSVHAPSTQPGIYYSAVCMQLHERPQVVQVLDGAWIVHLPGITHMLLDEKHYPPPCEHSWLAEEAAYWRSRFCLDCEAAVGVIRFRKERSELCIAPLVWVRDTNSSFFETACGSGSLAAVLVAEECEKLEEGRWHVRQPSGDRLTITTTIGDEAWQAWVGGEVKLLARGEAYIESLPSTPPMRFA